MQTGSQLVQKWTWLYIRLIKMECRKIKEATIQIGGNEKAEQVLDISSEKLDLSNINWKELNPAN